MSNGRAARATLIVLIVLASQFAVGQSTAAPVTRSAPYDVGLVCWHRVHGYVHMNGFGDGRFALDRCISDPYVQSPQHLEDPAWAPIAIAARHGTLMGGGRTRHEAPGNPIWWGAAVTRTQALINIGPAQGKTLTASALISGAVADTTIRWNMCIQILDGGYARSASCSTFAVGRLQTSTWTTPGSGFYQISVFIDSSGWYAHGAGQATVPSITYEFLPD